MRPKRNRSTPKARRQPATDHQLPPSPSTKRAFPAKPSRAQEEVTQSESPEALIKRLQRYERALQRLAKIVSRFETEIGDLADDFQLLEEDLLEALDNQKIKPPRRKLHRTGKDAQALVGLAQSGVSRVTVGQRLPRGSAMVHIDDTRIKLRRQLIDLIQILADESGESNDQFVGFKSVKDIARRLGIKSDGARAIRHNVQKLICDLKNAIEAAQGNRHWVEYDGADSYRLLRKRAGEEEKPIT